MRTSLLERKEQILSIAVEVFAMYGFYKATTVMIAQKAGVTQPYLFHFFKTKESLYLAVLEKGMQTIHIAFEQFHAPADQLIQGMREVFRSLPVSHRNELLLTMYSFVTPEPAIRDFARENHRKMYNLIHHKFSQAGIANASWEAKNFIGAGLMITLAEVLDVPELSPYAEG